MYKFKSENGITMVVLVVTIIVMFILAGVGMGLSNLNLSSTTNYKLSAELNMVQHAILEQYTKYKTTKDTSYLVGEIVTDADVNNIASSMGITLTTIPTTYSNKEYHKLDKHALEQIGIKDATDEYIVNYISGEVINITTKTLQNGEALYVRATSTLN